MFGNRQEQSWEANSCSYIYIWKENLEKLQTHLLQIFLVIVIYLEFIHKGVYFTLTHETMGAYRPLFKELVFWNMTIRKEPRVWAWLV